MTQTPQDDEQDDVVELLRAQHTRIRAMFTEFDRAAGTPARQDRFEELRRFLAGHETAEEIVVHPAARNADGGAEVVRDRLREEHDAKQVLSRLDGMAVTDPGFADDLATLREAVLAHADNEEREEFPLLQSSTDERTRARLAGAVRAAGALAPPHPRRGVEPLTATLLPGPGASLVDRPRAAVRGRWRGPADAPSPGPGVGGRGRRPAAPFPPTGDGYVPQ